MSGISRRQAIGSALAAAALTRSRTVSASPKSARRAEAQPLVDYLRANGPKLLRPAQDFFRHPSIAPTLPARQYSAELWDWDTLWTVRGLFALAEVTGDAALKRQVADHAKGSLLNFLDNQQPDGRLPIVMASADRDANRFPFATRDRNQAKPVMAQLALLIADRTGDAGWCGPIFDKLARFHDSWRAHNEAGPGLLVWSNDVAIGNDNDPTTFGRPPFSSANLLLNCLFYQDLRALTELAARLNRPAEERAALAKRIERLGAAILRECWDPRDAFFYTVDVQCVDRRAALITNVAPGMDMSWSTLPMRLQLFTGFLPLWCGLATAEQARAMIERNYLADDRLRAEHGVRTLSNRERMYTLAFSSNPSNWLGPVWIISNYFVWKALSAYGYRREADDLADKTVSLLVASLAADGSLNEYYHPDTGRPLSHKGFMDWNLLALEML
ncbi:hypothetical protein LZK98_16700 [Sphingomonas cannabina]|uniref:MGH1-like glycoside hydrolase domain-containing protein n=1 Tax=Sphingomonas cannabina TaxID=2899123 RepID=UPI001F210784|nr:trehalase family glycosidase [Sphingomonas cannabina]UIJ44675.1 hypothetical protein LZK98_16700 [Sphingomonas cannabina]